MNKEDKNNVGQNGTNGTPDQGAMNGGSQSAPDNIVQFPTQKKRFQLLRDMGTGAKIGFTLVTGLTLGGIVWGGWKLVKALMGGGNGSVEAPATGAIEADGTVSDPIE